MTNSRPAWLDSCLNAVTRARIAVFGDFCLDAYWVIDDGAAELSLETGLPIRRIRGQRYSLGGAGNVAANLASLGVGSVRAIGVVGADLFGHQLFKLLHQHRIEAAGIVQVDAPEWQTLVYGKPVARGIEESRMDFGAFNQLPVDACERVLAELDRAAAECDVVVLNQQIPIGVSTSLVIERINEIVAKHPRTRFIVDARDRPAEYRNCLLKVNVAEARRIVGEDVDVAALARRLRDRSGRDVFITRGASGIVVADEQSAHEVPGIQIVDRIDPVGAGDTVVAAVAAALAGGVDAVTAARFANVAASITVRKLHVTGTATPAEIRAVGPDPDYVYSPDLAADARGAQYVAGTEFEIVKPLPAALDIRHAIFDHDGTLSTLREGWERIMEPMMVRAILGDRLSEVSKETFDDVTRQAREFIDKTTGIQTLVQMQGLAKLVRDAGYVSPDKVLDEHGYKAIYNDLLLQMVRERVAKLKCGELTSEDFQIKNAHALLKRLHAKGVKLYLASGTDQADVIAEAEAMGYAELFQGRMFGAVGDVNVEAKKLVLERIIRENNLSGHEFVTFGDGPVEMRETRKRGGIAVGVCSDEVRGFGHNPAKRSRLIRGGATLLVPDFSQLSKLLKLLQLDN